MMKIEIKNGRAHVYTPYHPDFVEMIKCIYGARWCLSKKCWGIPKTEVAAAREMMTEVYGYSDITENETISLKITFNECASSVCGNIVLYGKVIAYCYGFSDCAGVGKNVAFVSGGATVSGDPDCWEIAIEKGSVVILTNVGKTIYENTKTDGDVTVEVIEGKADKQGLTEERERLAKRIEEIDRLLLDAV